MSELRIDENDGFVLIEMPDQMRKPVVEELNELAYRFDDRNVRVIVFDFRNTDTLNKMVYRPITSLAQIARERSKFLASVNLSRDLWDRLEFDGMAGVFNPFDSLASALNASGLQRSKKLDVNFVNPFITAAKETFEQQTKTPITIGDPILKSAAPSADDVDIAGVINLVSDVFSGAIALCFPKAVFLKIYENMMKGEKHDEITPEIQDAAGELLNIIFARARAELVDRKGFVIHQAIPTVIGGKQLSIAMDKKLTAIILPFKTAEGDFHMEIATDA